MRFFYVYAILFKKKDLECGVFSTTGDIFEGMTDENTSGAIAHVCQVNSWKVENVVSFSIRRLSPEFMGILSDEYSTNHVRPGNDGPKPPPEPGSGDRGGSGG